MTATREPIARTTIAIPASMHADLAREARVRGRSVSDLVRALIEAHLATSIALSQKEPHA